MDEYSEMIQTAIDPPALETLTFSSFGTISRSNNKKAHLQWYFPIFIHFGIDRLPTDTKCNGDPKFSKYGPNGDLYQQRAYFWKLIEELI